MLLTQHMSEVKDLVSLDISMLQCVYSTSNDCGGIVHIHVELCRIRYCLPVQLCVRPIVVWYALCLVYHYPLEKCVAQYGMVGHLYSCCRQCNEATAAAAAAHVVLLSVTVRIRGLHD